MWFLVDLWVITIKKAIILYTYGTVCRDWVNRAWTTDHTTWTCKRFVYSVQNNKIVWLSNMADTFVRSSWGVQRCVGFFSWLCFLDADWLKRQTPVTQIPDSVTAWKTGPDLGWILIFVHRVPKSKSARSIVNFSNQCNLPFRHQLYCSKALRRDIFVSVAIVIFARHPLCTLLHTCAALTLSLDPFPPRSDQPSFSLSVSHRRYIIQYGELGIW